MQNIIQNKRRAIGIITCAIIVSMSIFAAWLCLPDRDLKKDNDKDIYSTTDYGSLDDSEDSGIQRDNAEVGEEDYEGSDIGDIDTKIDSDAGSKGNSGSSVSSNSSSQGSSKPPGDSQSNSQASSGSNGNFGNGETYGSNGTSSGASQGSSASGSSQPQVHEHTVAEGNTGMWFESYEETEAYYRDEQRKWEEKFENGEITWDELMANEPMHWEWRQCMCGKYTLSWWTEETESN